MNCMGVVWQLYLWAFWSDTYMYMYMKICTNENFRHGVYVLDNMYTVNWLVYTTSVKRTFPCSVVGQMLTLRYSQDSKSGGAEEPDLPTMNAPATSCTRVSHST